jgi:ribonuclease G
MSQEILINVEPKETRCAFLKNGVLQDLVVERQTSRTLTGNIYRGKVKNILHNIQSAFIDIHEGENGFIHISDILENTEQLQKRFDMDFDFKEIETKRRKKAAEIDISKIVKPDQPVLVQVVKESIGSKGARLTSNISIAGRYLVMLPNTPHRGVSRKVEDRAARERLKKLIQAFEMPHDMGLICRTASVNASQEQLIQEAHDLLNTWKEIMEKFEKAVKPTCLYEESDLIKRSLITAIDKHYNRILIDDFHTYQRCKQLYTRYSNEWEMKIEYYRDKHPMFERFGVEREIDKALRRKIWLPSGGYLFLDSTEAMLTIDVNSGRSKDQKRTTNVEESLVRINMEAAEEMARQLRIRNIGGLIICDFIDMRIRKNQRRVLERLKEAMKEDSAKCTILGMSEFGLVEMTRQRNRESLAQTMFTSCPYCSGSARIKNHESVSIEIERALKKLILVQQQYAIKLVTHPALNQFLSHQDKNHFNKLAEKHNANLKFDDDDTLHINDFQFYSTTNGKPIDV